METLNRNGCDGSCSGCQHQLPSGINIRTCDFNARLDLVAEEGSFSPEMISRRQHIAALLQESLEHARAEACGDGSKHPDGRTLLVTKPAPQPGNMISQGIPEAQN